MQLKRHNVRKVFLYWQRGETSIDVLSPIYSIIYQNLLEGRDTLLCPRKSWIESRGIIEGRQTNNKGIEYEQRHLEDLFDVFGRNAACVFVLIELAELNKDECTTFFLAQRL